MVLANPLVKNRAALDDAVFLAVELDTLGEDGDCDATVFARFSALPWAALPGAARDAPSLVAALWLRAGLVAPRAALRSAWDARPAAQRLRLAVAMLELKPATAIRVLGAEALAALLREARDPAFHRLVARALTLCRSDGAERCLAAMMPEVRAGLAPLLAEAAGGAPRAHHGREIPNAPVRGRSEPGPSADLPSAAAAARMPPAQWSGIERRLGAMTGSVRRGQALSRLAPVAPAEQLPAFGALASELAPSAWRDQAKAALFGRALAVGLDPWSVVKGADRRDVLGALIGQRLQDGRLEALEHRAWRRLSELQRVALLRATIGRIAELPDRTRRGAALTALCEAIVGLPANLALIVAIQFIKTFNRDAALAPRQLWRLTEIGEATGAQRQELLRVAALAFWLRGNDAAGARCHAGAEACARRVATQTVRDFLAATPAPAGSEPEAAVRRSAAAMAMFEADNPDAPEQVAACLADLEPAYRGRFIAHLIAQGQAAHVLLALEDTA